jgi:hypothetical protein
MIKNKTYTFKKYNKHFKMFIVREKSVHSENPCFQNIKVCFSKTETSEKVYFVNEISQAKAIFENGIPEKQLIAWCTENFMKEKHIFLDINAGIGTYTLSLASGMKKVYAFEYDNKKFSCLASNVLLHDLSSKVTTFPFKISNETNLMTSILTYKLDDFPFLESNIGFIKAPGLKVIFEGAKTMLKKNNFPPILFTIDESNIAAIASKKDLFEYLESLSYKIVIINGVKDTFLAMT